jgi:hypothetical protein
MNSAFYTAISLMQEPFVSIPLIWLIHEDTLGKRLREYEEKGLDGLISQWRSSFNRANAIIFPDFSLPVKISLFCLYYKKMVPFLLFNFAVNFYFLYNISILPINVIYSAHVCLEQAVLN